MLAITGPLADHEIHRSGFRVVLSTPGSLRNVHLFGLVSEAFWVGDRIGLWITEIGLSVPALLLPAL